MDWLPGMVNGTMGDVGARVPQYLLQHPLVEREREREREEGEG